MATTVVMKQGSTFSANPIFLLCTAVVDDDGWAQGGFIAFSFLA
jgi:hypothetical protein